MASTDIIPGKKLLGLFGKSMKRLGEAIGKVDEAFDLYRKWCNSFVPGTMILMADGSTKPIEEVEVGDNVVATDPLSGKTESKPVVALIAGKGEKDLVQVTVDADGASGRKTALVMATTHHPFWVSDQGHWFEAGQLAPGMHLRGDDGRMIKVLSVRHYHRSDQRVYNLAVEDVHTFYVLAGNHELLVHNAGKPCIYPSIAFQDYAAKGAYLHIDGMEVSIYVNHKGELAGKGIRLKNGTASDKQVRAVINALKPDPKLRASVIRNLREVIDGMNSHNWGFDKNRALESLPYEEAGEDVMGDLDFYIQFAETGAILGISVGALTSEVAATFGQGFIDDRNRKSKRWDYGLLEFFFELDERWQCRGISVQIHRLGLGVPLSEMVPSVLRERYGEFARIPSSVSFFRELESRGYTIRLLTETERFRRFEVIETGVVITVATEVESNDLEDRVSETIWQLSISGRPQR